MNGRNKELQQELTELVRQRTAISEVLRAIASSPHDMQPIFDTILGSAVRLCRANVGTLRLCEETRLRVVAQLFDPNTLLVPPQMVYEPSSSLLAHLANGSPVHVSDLDLPHDTLFQDPAIQAIKSAGVRTFLGVPMLTEKRLIGTVMISRVRVEPFTDKEIELIMDFAAQAAIALEITRRERQLRDMQMELAHANRVATIGELTGSIVHEVKQPIAATVTNAQAALRFVGAEAVDLDKVRQILNDIVKDGNRAAEVISRIRDLFKKAPPRRDRWEINGAIREVIELTHGEAVKDGITVQTELPDGGCPRVTHWNGERGAGRRARRGARHRPRAERGEPSTPVRAVLYDEAERYGHGTFNLPIHHRRSRRTIVGDRAAPTRCSLSVYDPGSLMECLLLALSGPRFGSREVC
jgi:GAF domain-containing protein